jgi:type IV pilus assembly protein PilM
MPVPFLKRGRKKCDRIVAIDLGVRATKAVFIERDGERFRLVNYRILDAPVVETTPTQEALAQHLKEVAQALAHKTRRVILAIGAGESLVRHAEMPLLPVSDMRTVLKHNPKAYLQQDLPGYEFDCFIMPPRPGALTSNPSKGPPKCRVITGGARQQYLETLVAAAKSAGLTVDQIIPGLIGPANAFEFAQPEVFHKEVIALVDLGFKHSTISILELGELMLNRVVAIGGDRLTQGLAEALNISYAEAEGIKIGMPQEVASNLQPLLSPLGRELRVSIDFFEHQQDKTVSQVYVSGASARSEFILEAVQNELMIPCKGWNPTSFLEKALPPGPLAEIETAAALLAVAIGAAAIAF